MQAVILAGGLGTRLRPITESIPKPMVEVAGEPFLLRIVRWLVKCGFRRQLLLVGYRGEIIADFFGDGSKFGAEISYSHEPTPLGTGGALRHALDSLDEQFLLLYGDSYLPIDYREVERNFFDHPSEGLLVVYDNRLGDTGVTNNVSVDAECGVTRYQKGSGPNLDFVEAGALCFRRSIFEPLPEHESISLEEDLFPRLIAARQLRGFITKQRFYDIGTPQRLEEFASTL
jgi:NDP-sugar pyrophosphorylase family protein